MLFKSILQPIKRLISAIPLPKRGTPHLFKGLNAFYENQYGIAIKEFKLAIRKRVNKYDLPTVHTSLGNAYFAMGLLDEALGCHIKSLELNPENHVAWVNKGIVYENMGELGKAEKCYLQAQTLKPDYADIHESLGILHLQKDQPHKAIEFLEKSKQLNPSLVEARGHLALAYAMIGRFGEANYELKEAIMRGYIHWKAIKSRIEDLKQYKDNPDQITPNNDVNLN